MLAIRSFMSGLYAKLFMMRKAWSFERRDQSRARRGKPTQKTKLKRDFIHKLVGQQSIRLLETEKAEGNVNLQELAVLAMTAKSLPKPTAHNNIIFEIGTFDGRTALNLSYNADRDYQVITLDLPKDHPTKMEVDPGDHGFINKPESGARFKKFLAEHPSKGLKIQQVFGDSASFDFSPWYGKCQLVFVDGSHAYEYLKKDTETALKLIAPDGIILWHDYGVWDGVTKGLEEIEAENKMGIRHIPATSLVYYRHTV